ncbi:ISL3 family transposase [Mesobacillus subterraneus]|uniref:ISL3 family transposase n=1 Tax=Mesobacillus subterraneus TaxID=285983 RepID=UPI001CFC5F40|nr:ISL3 family transposase [Mesobacillus subterraneus]WLR53576.1 ISL3 family transposase [Mesobacillus subterraneus]
MLNLPEFEVLLKEQNEHFYRFTVERIEPPFICTNCGEIKSEYTNPDAEFKRHQVKERTVSDISMHGKAVRIIIRHRRWKCPFCDGTFYELLDSVDRNDKVTKRLKEHMKKLALKKPFTNIADEYGISHTSVRRYFEEYVEDMERDRYLVAPRVLGIDEAHLNKTMRGVFTDTENFKLLEITKDNTKRTVKETIQRMEGYKNIEVATIDMYSGYKYALQELVPDCYIVTDKFHVIQYAQRALDAIRIKVKKGLPKKEQRLLTYDRWVLLKNQEDLEFKEILKRNEWFELFPELKTAYWLKEGLRDIYKLSKDKQEALERFTKWESEIPNDMKEFKEIKKTFNNNKTEIFNYFDRPFTNAYTESINNIIKSVEKAGKGYSFDVLRAKVLYGTEATIKKPKYNDEMQFKRFDKLWGGRFNTIEPITVQADEPTILNCGVDLITLSKLLEEGDF